MYKILEKNNIQKRHRNVHIFNTNRFQVKPVEMLVTARSGASGLDQCVDVASMAADEVAVCEL